MLQHHERGLRFALIVLATALLAAGPVDASDLEGDDVPPTSTAPTTEAPTTPPTEPPVVVAESSAPRSTAPPVAPAPVAEAMTTPTDAPVVTEPSAPASQNDFNGDNFADLAIGVPLEDVAGQANAGAVNVIYGSAKGLRALGDQLWSQHGCLADEPQVADYFGKSLTAGDFNGDSYDDLAVGVPMEHAPPVDKAGAVNVIYGSANGLSCAGNQLWHQNSPSVLDVAEQGDGFGQALAAADFDLDGDDELAIGVPNEDRAQNNEGVVHVLSGTPSGLTAGQYWHQDHLKVSIFVTDDVGGGDHFGFALAAGDFGHGSHPDLAIGEPGDSSLGRQAAGTVKVMYGATGWGLLPTDAQWWTQNHCAATCIQDEAEENDWFGFSLAAADFGLSHEADLAIGVPYEDHEGIGAAGAGAGAVNVLFGTLQVGLGSGSSAFPNQFLYPGVNLGPGGVVLGTRRPNAHFGEALTTADFDGNGYGDLAASAPYGDWPSRRMAPTVHVFHGQRGYAGLTGHDDALVEIPGVPAEVGDEFGIALTAANFGRSAHADLAVGAPRKTVNALSAAGGVGVLYGAPGGLDPATAQFWHQTSDDIEGTAEAGDNFGAALATLE